METHIFETIYTGNQEHYIEGKITTNAVGTKASKKTLSIHHRRPPLVEHQEGSTKIGLYPFVDRFNVDWGAIDIDTYPVNHEEIVKKLDESKVDYSWITKSTSGGCHIYFRFKEAVMANVVRKELSAIAKKIGYGKSEIFPKQDQFQPKPNEETGGYTGLGNAIYLPYGSDNSCVMSTDGKEELSMDQFLMLAPERFIKFNDTFSKSKTTTSKKPKDVEQDAKPREKLHEREILWNGPPCLNRLNTSGIEEGGRNEALFNFAVMLKKANGEAVFDQLKAFNDACQPPLSDTAVRRIISSVNGGEYKYRCKEEPLTSYCNAAVCAKRKFGIDETMGADLEKFPWVYAKNDNWFVQNETGQIITPDHFSNVCTAEYYWNEVAEKPHNKTSYLGSRETDKVDRVGYHPARPDRYKRNGLNHINVYRPSLLEPVAGDIKPWLDVIEYQIDDPDQRHMYHSWIHSVITNPGLFITWSPLVITKQGLGKDLIGRGIGACVGIHNTFNMDMKLIMQQHTGHLLHKCFGIMSETKEYGTSDRGKAMEVIKPLITDLDLKIRAMHKDAYWVENVINCMFYSNHENCITLDMDARRFFVLMTNKPRQSREFYAPCWQLVNDNPGVIYDYYLNKFQPHKDFHAGGDAPETKFKKILVHNTDNADFIALDAFAEQGMYPFQLDNPYYNIAHLAYGFKQQRAGAKYDFATIEYWMRWRAKQDRAEQHADIDINGERIRIWTLDPENYRETDRKKLRDEYLRPTEYGGHKTWNWDKEEKCGHCGRKHTPASKEYVNSPF